MIDTTTPRAEGQQSAKTPRHRVVIIGAGFGGLFAAKALRRSPVEVTLIDRSSHHLFQPLLYQVATGILSEGEIAPSIRDILRYQRNVRVRLGDVTDIDAAARIVTSSVRGVTTRTGYDSLIVAAGAGQSYFGHDEFAVHAPGLKNIDDALRARARIFGAYEMAELTTDPVERDAWLTFVVVGGGPTGVEMAGQLAELPRRSLEHNYRSFDPRTDTKVVLVEAGPALLSTYGPKLSAHTVDVLSRGGVDVRLDTKVVGIDAAGVDIADPTVEGENRIPARTIIWAAGVRASPLTELLAAGTGAEVNRAGQLALSADLTLPGHPEIFVVGDLMQYPHPGVAQLAIQSGRFAARRITASLAGNPKPTAFHYRNKGDMATIARFHAIARVGPVPLSGVTAWSLWLVVHLFYLIGFKNRLAVLANWTVSCFVGRARPERTVTLRETGAEPPERPDLNEPFLALPGDRAESGSAPRR